MNLTEEEFNSGKKIVENTLKIDLNDIEKYLNDVVSEFKINLDLSELDNRYKVFSFLDHISTLFLNIMLNSNLYLLGEKEEKKAEKARQIILKIVNNFREDFN